MLGVGQYSAHRERRHEAETGLPEGRGGDKMASVAHRRPWRQNRVISKRFHVSDEIE
jgi:hypothetical protein